MENTAPAPKADPIKKARSKVYNRYNAASLAVLFQVLIVTSIVGILQIIVTAVNVANMAASGDVPDKMSSVMSFGDYTMVVNGIAYIFANTLVAILMLKFTKTARLRDFIRKPEMNAFHVVLAIFVALGISSIDSIIMNLLDSVFGSSNEALGELLGSGLFSDKPVAMIGSILYIALIGPITEEFLLRGCVLPMSSHVSARAGIFLSALLFGLMHGNIGQIFNAFLLGLALAYVTVKSRSIVPAILMHIANNSYSVIMSFVCMDLTEAQYKTLDLVTSIVFAVLGIVSAIILILKYKGVDDKAERLPVNLPAPEEDIEKAKTPANRLKYKTIFSTWAFWLVVAYAIFNSIIMSFAGSMMQ
ncbi:MAG: CPBP family intramembrane metalloprotease [Saccharofermentans sp.]|nr:CPBP family intramembrane metalloprotease [Saccharofermentans sp.]